MDQAVARYRAATFAEGTKATYQTHRRSYINFCLSMGYCPVPVSSTVLCRYAAHLAERLKFSSIQQYLNIVRILHLESDLPNPLEHNWPLKSVLMGIKRVHGNHTTHKEPITPSHLLHFKTVLNLSDVRDAAFWASALIAFYGLFRKSNVLTNSIAAFSKDKHLCRSDFRIFEWGVEIIVRWTKTIQCQERVLRVPIPAMPGHPLCPVSALISYLRLTSLAPSDGPAFVIPGKTASSFVPYTPVMFLRRLRALLSQVEKDPSHFATHSFRRGGASWALQCGLPAEVIRVLGDWRSDAYLAYIDIPRSSRLQMARVFASSLPNGQ